MIRKRVISTAIILALILGMVPLMAIATEEEVLPPEEILEIAAVEEEIDAEEEYTAAATAIVFGCPNFEKAVLSELGRTTGPVLDTEVAEFVYLDLYEMEITSLKGIEFFTSLVELGAGYNLLTDVDLSKNTELVSLFLGANQIKTLDLSNNLKLVTLFVWENELTSVNISKNSALEYLVLDGNNLTAIDISNNPILKGLSVDDNQLTSIDISQHLDLEWLHVGGIKQMPDISKHTKIFELGAWGANISELDISHLTELTWLVLGGNQLKTLDISKNTNLMYLYLWDNQLTTLDVSKNVNLINFNVGSNLLTSLDVSNNRDLLGLWVDWNWLPSIEAIIGLGNTKVDVSDDWSFSFYPQRSDDIGILPQPGDYDFVRHLYDKFFDREADLGGLEYWAGALATGQSGRDVAISIASSEEFMLKHTDNVSYVTALYWGLLGRAPEADGLAFWVDAMNRFPENAKMLLLGEIASSVEFGMFFSTFYN